jgi:hypothetical protein
MKGGASREPVQARFAERAILDEGLLRQLGSPDRPETLCFAQDDFEFVEVTSAWFPYIPRVCGRRDRTF